MPATNEPYTIYERGWVVRIRKPAQPGSQKVLLLLHGWTGDETVMWVFARHLPTDYWVFAPRGIEKAPTGYGWTPVQQGVAQRYYQYAPVAAQLMQQVKGWCQSYKFTPAQIDLMGFSQGAALAYTLLVDFTDQIGKTAALAGFLPDGSEDHLNAASLQERSIFIAHGSQDRTVPIEQARHAAHVFQRAGAKVTTCEDPVGHKLGAACSKGLAGFFQ